MAGDLDAASDNRRASPLYTLGGWIVVVLILALLLVAWQIFATRPGMAVALPRPSDVWTSFTDLMDQRVLWQATIATGRSWAAAFAVAAILGVAIGLATGSGRALGALLSPAMLVFGAFPLPALATLLVLWMGLGTAAGAITAGALLALFPIAAMVARSRPSPDAGLRLKCVFHAFEIGVVLALFGVLFTEMLAGRGRLGSMVIELQSNFETKRLLALVFYLWLLGLAAALPFAFCRWISGFGR